MNIQDISLPEIYKSSADFRFFCKWFEYALSKLQYDTENGSDIYDPLRCPEDLLWMLADTMGYKFDDRLPTAFNRLVLLYFMSMIRNRGSKNGMLLAAETNLAQFNIINYGIENDILNNRLEDTSIPVNSVYVTPYVQDGYIDVVYFSEQLPTDACIEYVRPLGMYTLQSAGVRYDSRTRISVDARLTNVSDTESIGSTRVGHYTRKDYAELQKADYTIASAPVPTEGREKAWARNSVAEGQPTVDAGYRALYSLQLSNNAHIVESLLPHIFGLGYEPQQEGYTEEVNPVTGLDEFQSGVTTNYPLKYGKDVEFKDGILSYNLRYDKIKENEISRDVYTVEENSSQIEPTPAVNPVMAIVGDKVLLHENLHKSEGVSFDYIFTTYEYNQIITDMRLDSDPDYNLSGLVPERYGEFSNSSADKSEIQNFLDFVVTDSNFTSLPLKTYKYFRLTKGIWSGSTYYALDCYTSDAPLYICGSTVYSFLEHHTDDFDTYKVRILYWYRNDEFTFRALEAPQYNWIGQLHIIDDTGIYITQGNIIDNIIYSDAVIRAKYRGSGSTIEYADSSYNIDPRMHLENELDNWSNYPVCQVDRRTLFPEFSENAFGLTYTNYNRSTDEYDKIHRPEDSE